MEFWINKRLKEISGQIGVMNTPKRETEGQGTKLRDSNSNGKQGPQGPQKLSSLKIT